MENKKLKYFSKKYYRPDTRANILALKIGKQ